MKKSIIILISLGIIIFSYPLADRAYSRIMQWRQLTEVYYSLNQEQEELNVNQYENLQNLFEDGIDENETDNNETDSNAQETIENNEIQTSEPDELLVNHNDQIELENTSVTQENKANEIKPDLLGTITINKINAKLPIVYGATYSNLKVGAGQIAGTTTLGEVGNSVLSAHRSYTYGRFFNRLDELEIGDTIDILTTNGNYVYKVYEKKIVEPTDVSVLKKNNTDKVLTLITCHPIRVASHRLIVHSVRIN